MTATEPTPSEPTDRRPVIGIVAVVLGILILGVGGLVANRTTPSRCGDGFVALGARCCGEGQTLRGQRCEGKPSRCGEGSIVQETGCVAAPKTVTLPGGSLQALALDWEAEGHASAPNAVVAPFRVDVFEVIWARYAECMAAGKCVPVTPAGEPGQPVTRVTVYEAARFCAYANGRLASDGELLFASAGVDGRRFPWGPNGAVCKRAAWGLTEGPCASGSSEPDVTGSHPYGRSPEGVEDLAGNVAEWTLPRPDGFAVVRGGSFRDREATSLKTWATRVLPADTRADDVGFRCVYDP